MDYPEGLQINYEDNYVPSWIKKHKYIELIEN